jgi:glycine/D-amino acid oxidase-like deaminating enzyme
MGPYADAVYGDIDLPAKTDVVIIGGGIIGVSAALHLALAGHQVTLCEKGYIACEQSSRNWGWCRQAGRDEREMPLITESMRLWRDMKNRTGSTGGYVECGTLYVGDDEAERAEFERWLDMAKPYETGARMISGAEFEARAKTPAKGRFGLLVPTDGCAEPHQAAPAIARAAQAAGAKILGTCAVRGVELSAGRVSGVVTERGRIACSSVLIAAGSWTSLLCDGLDYTLPQLKVPGTVLRTSRIDDGPQTNTWMGRVGFRKRQDGGYTIADGSLVPTPVTPASFRFFKPFLPMLAKEWKAVRPRLDAVSAREFFGARPALDKESVFERVRVLEPKPDMKQARQALAAMAEQYPAFRTATIAQAWAGYMDASPDAIPYIGAMPDRPGVFVATGFSGHGFGIGPAAGGLAARFITGHASAEDHASMRLNRFRDGSKIVVGPGV